LAQSARRRTASLRQRFVNFAAPICSSLKFRIFGTIFIADVSVRGSLWTKEDAFLSFMLPRLSHAPICQDGMSERFLLIYLPISPGFSWTIY
jgi:hypothetical protein